MEDIKAQQIEALRMAGEYCTKLINAIDVIVKEYEGAKLPDTNEYLKEIINGLNWTFEVFNGTQVLLNDNKTGIDKEKVNKAVIELNAGVTEQDDKKIASALKGGILEFVSEFKIAADKKYA